MEKKLAGPFAGIAARGPAVPREGVRRGQMLWIGGQIDRRANAAQQSFAGQVNQCVSQLDEVLSELGGSLSALVKLLCFYVVERPGQQVQQERELLAVIAERLPAGTRPAITLLPLPYLAEPEAKVLLEGYAMLAEDGTALPRQYASGTGLAALPAAFAGALRCGKMIFVSAQHAVLDGHQAHPGEIVPQTHQVMKQIANALGEFGAGLDDVVKINRWYQGQGSAADFEPAALACASHFSEPGPAATGIPLPAMADPARAIQIEVVAMLGEDGSHLPRRHAWPETLWDWTVHLPYHHGLKCHDMVFLGGQVALNKQGHAVEPYRMTAQTGIAMGHINAILDELGVPYDDVCKHTTYFEGPSDPALTEEIRIARAQSSPQSGLAISDVPFPKLAYPGMIIEIDTFAITLPD